MKKITLNNGKTYERSKVLSVLENFIKDLRLKGVRVGCYSLHGDGKATAILRCDAAIDININGENTETEYLLRMAKSRMNDPYDSNDPDWIQPIVQLGFNFVEVPKADEGKLIKGEGITFSNIERCIGISI